MQLIHMSTIIVGSHDIADISPSATVAHVSSRVPETTKLTNVPRMIVSIKKGIDNSTIIPCVVVTFIVRHHRVTGQTHA
jgi:hypothetical protein